MKQDFQEKGKYMKVKEFLENFTGDNHIKIYDMHSFDTHRYNNANEAIKGPGRPFLQIMIRSSTFQMFL